MTVQRILLFIITQCLDTSLPTVYSPRYDPIPSIDPGKNSQAVSIHRYRLCDIRRAYP